MGKKIVDHHDFSLWRYEDDSVDISCNRSECDVDPRIAYMEASVLARTMAEDMQQNDEVFSSRVFSDGTVSTQWRGETGFAKGWKQFLWVKRRLNQAGHSGVLSTPKAPDLFLIPMWVLEFILCSVRGFFSETPPEQRKTPILQETEQDDNVIALPLKNRS